MLAATVALEAVLAGTDRERAIAMARFALDGDHLIAVDDGLFWVNAAAVRMLADDDIGDFWSRARAVSHARGSLFAMLSISLWEGFWQWRRGELHEALACLRGRLDQDRLWGGTGVGEPFAPGSRSSATSTGVTSLPRVGRPTPSRRTAFGEGGRVYSAGRGAAARRRGPLRGGPCGRRAQTPDGIAIANPVWNPWRSITAAALHGLGRTAEAIEAGGGGTGSAPQLGRTELPRQGLCLLGELRGRDGLDDLRRRCELLSSTPAAVDLARAQCALGSRPEVRGRGGDRAAAGGRAGPRSSAAPAGARPRSGGARAARPPDRAPADEVPPLSRTERQILDLTAAGLDVHEVAQRLFVTPGTVRAVLDEAGSAAAQSAQVFLKSDRVTMTHDQNGRLQ